MMHLNSLERVSLIVLAAGLLTRGGEALAQSGEGLSLETFQPSTSVNSFFELVLPEPKAHLEWSVGGLAHYAHEPLRRESRVAGEVVDEGFPVAHRATVELSAALGLFGFAEIGLAVPVIAYQDGEGGRPGGDIQPAGIGDPRLELKARVLDTAVFDLGLGALVTAPVGHYASSGEDILGSPLPAAEPRALASLEVGPFVAALDVGFLVRDTRTIGDVTQTHALTWNAGLAVDSGDFGEPGGLRIAVETNGEAGIAFDTLQETPMEVLAGIEYRLQNDVILSAGGGPGLSSGIGTPAFRVFAAVAYDEVRRSCPAGEEDVDGFEDGDKCVDPDNDADGLLDVRDRCPDEAEDADGFEDDDGCPDRDNDGDTIQDAVDKCPMLPEDRDGFEDDDGCPEEGPGKPTVKITDTQLLLSNKIYFDYNKDTIKEVSFPILDALAEALRANPRLKKIRIEGHTDNEGTEEYNRALSLRRAEAVKQYLIGKNIAMERLTCEGYGFSRPKASNRSEEGKAINRRVEFTILEKE